MLRPDNLREMLRLANDGWHNLSRSTTVAKDYNIFSLELNVMPPLGRMEDGAIEVLNPRNVEFPRLDELTSAGEEELTLVNEYVIRVYMANTKAPTFELINPFTLLNVHAEGHLGRQLILVGDLLQIPPKLIMRRQDSAPVWIWLE